MAGYYNNMSALINKIERRLEILPLTPHLPEYLSKDKWADVIIEDSLDTFSRFYPKKITFNVNPQTAPMKDGWYYIDLDLLGGQKVLGVGDIDWSSYSYGLSSLGSQFTYGVPNFGISSMYNSDQIQMLSMQTDYASMFNNNIYPELEYPNKLRIVAIGNKIVDLGNFNIVIYVKHPDHLCTIAPTKMETFEQLAMADVATFLFGNLKYWDGFETVMASLDLKLSKLEEEAGKRESVVEKLEQSYISAGNEAIPFFIVD